MKTLFLALAIMFAGLPALAQTATRLQMQTYNNANVTTNGEGAITGSIINNMNSQFINNMAVLGDTNTFRIPLAGDGSRLVVTPSGGPSPIALSDIAAAALSQPAISGTIAPNHLVIGGPDAHTLYDSGLTVSNWFNNIRDPGVNDDSTQGYIKGSLGYNQLTGQYFYCFSNGIGVAVWIAFGSTPSLALPYGWSFSNVAAGASAYTVPGSINGPNQNTEALMSRAAILSNLRIHVVSPGAGKNTVATIYTGAAGAMVASTVTCTVTGASGPASTDCADVTHQVSMTTGQAWAVLITVDAGANATAVSAAGILITPQ